LAAILAAVLVIINYLPFIINSLWLCTGSAEKMNKDVQYKGANFRDDSSKFGNNRDTTRFSSP